MEAKALEAEQSWNKVRQNVKEQKDCCIARFHQISFLKFHSIVGNVESS